MKMIHMLSSVSLANVGCVAHEIAEKERRNRAFNVAHGISKKCVEVHRAGR
jgi:hypothetical protein